MALEIYNTLTRKREPFVPMHAGKVSMYVCGPTVYNLTHVGNARPAVFFDAVRRFLEFSGYQVCFVSNFTDVDDKIIVKARQEKIDSREVSEKYIEEFKKDMGQLGIRPPTIAPKVTEHIEQIIHLVTGLIEKGAAYVTPDGEVLYSVRKFAEYGKLSGKKIDDLRVGVRIDADEKKHDPLDFSLWKPQKAADEPAWESPWGKGRPGWHIECSAMALAHLGETFDIHGGGLDLCHPHHENEIAQTEAFTGKPYVNYWLHNNLVSFQNEKMSKSIGNIVLNRDFMKLYGAETLRFLLLSGHYRSPIDFSEKTIRDSQSGLHRIYSSLVRANAAKAQAGGPNPVAGEETLRKLGDSFEANWKLALEDDFNTPKAFAMVFDYVRTMNAYLEKKGFKPTAYTPELADQFLENFRKLSTVLNLFASEPVSFLKGLKQMLLEERGLTENWVDEKIAQRTAARAAKDFATSDSVRDELLAQGILLLDSSGGTDWDIKFSA